ncbi:DUF2059 domain-containing protein [Lentisphaerota bacterium WC36G]|nr:DUF2059 domain-containing protein [Lentisphaerae bacterium WC36]
MSKKLLTISAVAVALTLSTGYAHCGGCGAGGAKTDDKKSEAKKECSTKKSCPNTTCADGAKKECSTKKSCPATAKKKCADGAKKSCPKKDALIEEMLKLSECEKQYKATIDVMLDNMRKQFSAAPQGLKMITVIENFFDKYFSYSVVKPVIVKAYSEEFTADEIKALNKFYQTETGKMLVKKQPILVKKMNGMIMSMFQEKQMELQKMIQEEIMKDAQPQQ